MHSYSSIGQFANFLTTIKESAEYHQVPVPILEMRGTVKLHGSNCAVYMESGELCVQSRNRRLTADDDFNYFHAFVQQHADYFKDFLKDYPESTTVYGEWCRDNRAGMGITALGAMFVVFDVELDKEAMPYKLPANDKKIYDIRDFQQFSLRVDVRDLEAAQQKITELTLEVERECPVARQLGSIGLGEGIVWVCVTKDAKLQTYGQKFKSKGPLHKITNRKTAEIDVERLASIEEFADLVVTEARLHQGLDYLREFNLSTTMENIGTYLAWFNRDVLKEESKTLEISQLDKKEVLPMVQARAKKFYMEEVRKQTVKMKL